MGDWSDVWEDFAQNAVNGRWAESGAQTLDRRRSGVVPETPARVVENNDE